MSSYTGRLTSLHRSATALIRMHYGNGLRPQVAIADILKKPRGNSAEIA